MSFPNFIFLLCTLLFSTSLAISTPKSSTSITLDLIHKDSFHTHTEISYESQYYDRLHTSLQRSINSTNRMNTSDEEDTDAAIRLLPSEGDYLMKMSIGTPPVDIYATLDTRSDLLWTQCKSCVVCFNQNGPYYDPSNSSTYAPIPCGSSLCYPSLHNATNAFSSMGTTCSNNSCYYFQREGSFMTDGILATERVTLGDVVTLTDVTFGCGMFNAYDLADVDSDTHVLVSGSVGLGPGPTSLVSTIYEYSLTTDFSYCLSPPFVNGTSKIAFGAEYEDSNDTKSTPMWFSAPNSDYRFVLSSISVGDEVVVLSQDNQTVLNMIMDVGTPLTYIPVNLYEEVALQIESQTKHLSRAVDPLAMLSPCYNVSTTATHALSDADIPKITLRLGIEDGAGLPPATSLKLKAANTFIKTADDVACLAFVPTRSTSTGVYGNLAQMGFMVTYDLLQSMLSFKEVDCSSV